LTLIRGSATTPGVNARSDITVPRPASGEREGPAKREGEGRRAMAFGIFWVRVRRAPPRQDCAARHEIQL
jgi:hypothetical protein